MKIDIYTTENRYNVIYADPAWSYRNKKTGGSHKSGAGQLYTVMKPKEIELLPVPATKDSVCFMWTTTPMMHEALHVMAAWGYRYIGMVTWEKTGRLGLGYWLRVNTEHMLYGVRGKVPCWRSSVKNIIRAPVGKHSEKPEAFRKLIEKLTQTMPDRAMLEMFARKHTPGWDCWGNEV